MRNKTSSALDHPQYLQIFSKTNNHPTTEVLPAPRVLPTIVGQTSFDGSLIAPHSRGVGDGAAAGLLSPLVGMAVAATPRVL